MTTPPKQSPLLALALPVVFVAGALVVGAIAGGWLTAGATSSLDSASAEAAEP
ncbi:hypothetical protein [Methylobacterium sp. ID0610]|uniref:hypothetical protein n=1 Tax=Methylobacterium carpenticola TaxID=3344827 RepID=UPI00367DE2D8